MAQEKPHSIDPIADGIAELSAGQYETALTTFSAAAKASPRDAEAAFYRGVALNRLARFSEATAAFEQARQLGYARLELGFETGWSLLGIGDNRRAAAVLEDYEAKAPGRGKTSEFLGRAYFALGELDRAEVLLRQAMLRDPRLRSTTEFMLAAIEFERHKIDRSAEHLNAILRAAPASPLAQILGEQLRRQVQGAAPMAKPWQVMGSLSVGYDDNAIVLGDGQPLPTGITRKGAAFLQLGAGGSYDVLARPGVDRLSAEYGLAARRYDGIAAADAEAQFASLDYTRRLGEDWAGRLGGFGSLATRYGEAFRGQAGVIGTLSYSPAPGFTIEPAISETWNYFSKRDITSAADLRSGMTNNVGATAYLQLPSIASEARVGLLRSDTHSDGSNFDYESWAFVVGASRELFWSVRGDLAFTFTKTDFANPDTRATPTLAFKRADQLKEATLQLDRPITGALSAYVRLDYTVNDSNIAVFEFSRLVTMTGIVLRY